MSWLEKIEWNKVTWYSQVTAVILGVSIFMLGIFLGFRWGQESRELQVSEQQDNSFDATRRALFGAITDLIVHDGKYYITFDRKEWLSGEGAQKALKEAGICDEANYRDCIVYDDYFIVNSDPGIEVFEVSPQAEIRIINKAECITGGCTTSLEDFIANDVQAYIYHDVLNHPYDIVVQNNRVTSIKERYVP